MHYMPNKGLNSIVRAVIKFMPGNKTFYDTQERHTETQTENSSLLHWQTHIISQKYSNQRRGHHGWKQDPETSSDSTSLYTERRHIHRHRQSTTRMDSTDYNTVTQVIPGQQQLTFIRTWYLTIVLHQHHLPRRGNRHRQGSSHTQCFQCIQET